MDDDHVWAVGHFRQRGKDHKPIWQASLIDFTEIPVQPSVFVGVYNFDDIAG